MVKRGHGNDVVALTFREEVFVPAQSVVVPPSLLGFDAGPFDGKTVARQSKAGGQRDIFAKTGAVIGGSTRARTAFNCATRFPLPPVIFVIASVDLVAAGGGAPEKGFALHWTTSSAGTSADQISARAAAYRFTAGTMDTAMGGASAAALL